MLLTGVSTKTMYSFSSRICPCGTAFDKHKPQVHEAMKKVIQESDLSTQMLLPSDKKKSLLTTPTSGAVHLMGICLVPAETMYIPPSSSRLIPKSEILRMSSSPTRQFRAARSRWIQLFDSKYAIPLAASVHIKHSFCFVWWPPFFLKKSKNAPPGINSITMYTGSFSAQMPISLTIFGWSYCFRISASLRNLSISCRSLERHVFTATFPPTPVARFASHTSPKHPFPIFLLILTSSWRSAHLSNLVINLLITAPEAFVTGVA